METVDLQHGFVRMAVRDSCDGRSERGSNDSGRLASRRGHGDSLSPQ